MKKLLATVVFSVTLALSFHVEQAEASSQEITDLTVKTHMTPTSISAEIGQPKTITIESNVTGPNYFQFNPGNGEGWRGKNGTSSRVFDQWWSQSGTYTYQGMVTNRDLGPAQPVSGTAKIRY